MSRGKNAGEITATRVENPLPPVGNGRRVGKKWNFLREMQVGECFDVDGATVAQVRAAVYYVQKYVLENSKFTVSADCFVWRVK